MRAACKKGREGFMAEGSWPNPGALANPIASRITRPSSSEPRRRKGHAEAVQNAHASRQAAAKGDREMPKLKTKSGAKKRFRFTASGKIKHGQTRKRHGMIKRSNEQIRNLRGTRVLSDTETQRVKRWMPYAG